MEIKLNSVNHGCCLELMKSIPDESIDMIFADLPFGTTKCKWDSIIDLVLMWEQYERIIKPNGAILLFAQTPFDKLLGASNLRLLRYEWIWQKTHPTGHMNAKLMPMKAHENILVFYKKLPTYNFIKTQGHKKKSAKRGVDNCDIYGKQNTEGLSYDSTERYPLSVQVFASDKQKSSLHPTQKPVPLIEYFIKTYSNEGDTVLDNVAGSGTLGIGCINTNRNYILMEKEIEMIDVINTRISEHKKSLTLK